MRTTSNSLKRKLRIALMCAAMTVSVTQPVQASDLAGLQDLAQSGQRNVALEGVNTLLENNPKDVHARFFKGILLTELNRKKDAIQVFQKMIEEFPSIPEPYNNLAVLHAQEGNYERARTALEKAIRAHPSYATAYENLGDVYAQLAGQAYKKAFSLDGSKDDAKSKLGMMRELVALRQINTTGPGDALNSAPVSSVKPAAVSLPAVAQKPKDAEPVVEKAAPSLAEKAAPVKVPAEATTSNDDITQALDGWVKGWESQNFSLYMNAYSSSFVPPKGASRGEWELDRDRALKKAQSIKVSVSDVQVQKKNDTATVTFKQHYASASYKDSTKKKLTFVREGNKWLIYKEEAL